MPPGLLSFEKYLYKCPSKKRKQSPPCALGISEIAPSLPMLSAWLVSRSRAVPSGLCPSQVTDL